MGDSFTVGDQVSNNETWPSCLEKKTSITTDNAGLSGYGTAQAVRRGIIESNKRKYDYLIWSVLFGDFDRDINNDLIETTTNTQFFGALPKLYLEIIGSRGRTLAFSKNYCFQKTYENWRKCDLGLSKVFRADIITKPSQVCTARRANLFDLPAHAARSNFL